MNYEVTYFQLGGPSDYPEPCHSYEEADLVARKARDSYLYAHPGKGLRGRHHKDKYQAVRPDGTVEFQAWVSLF